MKKTYFAALPWRPPPSPDWRSAVPAPAGVQVIVDYGRPYYGLGIGHYWHGYRRGYYARWHRYLVQVCHWFGRWRHGAEC